ncbi:hypothetical protein [Nocardioides alcanivorans]|uniref:hypothetical protein n=1 Tax=Nocardioides alcanivorans TaxID=2897352 RepID=UPI001F41BF09|nr:hypothetical protein [Nocardioides alcanivorans]
MLLPNIGPWRLLSDAQHRASITLRAITASGTSDLNEPEGRDVFESEGAAEA